MIDLCKMPMWLLGTFRNLQRCKTTKGFLRRQKNNFLKKVAVSKNAKVEFLDSNFFLDFEKPDNQRGTIFQNEQFF